MKTCDILQQQINWQADKLETSSKLELKVNSDGNYASMNAFPVRPDQTSRCN